MPRLASAVPKNHKKFEKGIDWAVVKICGKKTCVGHYNTKASRIDSDRLIIYFSPTACPSRATWAPAGSHVSVM